MSIFSYWTKEKFWMTPVIYSVFAVLLSIGFFYVDLLLVERFKEYIPFILLTKVDLAKTIMGALSGALLTMSTFTFSTILVVLTMYSSQFSPRALKNFVHDPVTWRVLGVFLGGFIYNTLSLLFMREHLYSHDVISTFVGILIAFSCLATFAYFIHYIATTVQVGKLVDELIKDTEKVIHLYKKLEDKTLMTAESVSWSPIGVKTEIAAQQEGYLQFIALDKIESYAEEHEIEVEIKVSVGDYVYEGMPLMQIYSKNSTAYSMKKFYSIGSERIAEQDIAYALQKLVEIALRAISPGINDPNTANDIILRIGSLLGKIGSIKTGTHILATTTGNNLVKYHFPSYHAILYNVFFQLSHFGKEDISVLYSITDSLRVAAKIAPEKHHETIWKMQLYVLEVLEKQQLKSYDHASLQEKIDALAEATNQRPIILEVLEGKI
ncbi:DUF2254 domain-containing protein [Planococcus sp. 1R117A]|uniref:DUF2254 domain-containing protein n=1 Tax=Planococcus sp. 1R117A TaxID=3447020 RepID=UPI003EDC2AE3